MKLEPPHHLYWVTRVSESANSISFKDQFHRLPAGVSIKSKAKLGIILDGKWILFGPHFGPEETVEIWIVQCYSQWFRICSNSSREESIYDSNLDCFVWSKTWTGENPIPSWWDSCIKLCLHGHYLYTLMGYVLHPTT